MKREPEPLLYLLLFAEGIILSQLFRFLPLTICSLIFIQAVITGRLFRGQALLITIIIAGFLYPSLFFHPDRNDRIVNFVSGKEYTVQLITTGLPIKSQRGFLQPVELLYPEVTFDKCYLITDSPLKPSKMIYARANLFYSSKPITPGVLFERGNTLFIKTREYSIKPLGLKLSAIPDILRWRLYRKIHDSFSSEVAMLLDAIVIGHRDSTDSDLYRSFSRLGLSHLMSISGTHFGLLAFIVFTIVRQLARLLPYRALIWITRKYSLQEYAALITVFFVSFYLMLSGGRVPAVRAFIMIMLFLAGLLWGRDTGWKYALALAAVIILIINPDAFLQPAFQLSFMAVWFIGSVFEWIDKLQWFKKQSPFMSTLIKLTMIPVIAFTGTSVLSVFYFHQIPVLSIPLNILITPIVCFLIIPVSLFASLFFLLSGVLPFTGLIAFVSGLVIKLVYLFSSIKWTVLPVRAFPVAVLLCFYLFLIPLVLRRSGLSISGLVLLVLSIGLSVLLYGFRKPMVTFLDVGQGDSAVVETSDYHTLVFDTGNTGKATEAYLRYRGSRGVDALVLSHAGHDHAGGFFKIIKDFDVKEVWDNGELLYSFLPSGIKHRCLKAGDILKTSTSSFTVLHPFKGYYNRTGADDNNNCLVVKYAEGPLSVLFTGDIEMDAEASLLRLKNYLESTVLKVAHHGSHTSSTPSFLSAVSPEIAVISVGVHNSYGHPHPEVLKRLSYYRLLRTDRDGTIRVYVKRDGTIGTTRYRDMLFEEIHGRYNLQAELRNLKRLFLTW